MLVPKSTTFPPTARPRARPIAVAATQAGEAGPPWPRAHVCAAPRTAPLIAPPTSAAVVASIGPAIACAATAPSGKPANDTIHRPKMRAVEAVSVWSAACISALLPGVDGRDPGGQHVVGVVGEVIAHERVEPVVVTVEMGRGDGHELAIARGRRLVSGLLEQGTAVVGQEGRDD